MSHWKIQVPKPSAKRLENNRTLIINENGAFHSQNWEFPIPEGVDEFEFDFEFKEGDSDVYDVYDGDIHYNCYVEYKNSIGSRVEQINIDPEEVE